MKITGNLHTHSTWCDGANTQREMAEAALAAGFDTLGFSSHAPAPFDPSCLGVSDEAAYCGETRALAAEYRGRMHILCGIEMDYYTPIRRELYDYVIGSVHYMPVKNGSYNAADADRDTVLAAKNNLYGGDGIAMARDYYGLVVQHVRENRPEIVGHFDVLAKQNAGDALFDEESDAYREIALAALDEVLDATAAYGGIIEVNTGAMARGLRAVPYPAPFLLRHMAQRPGTRVMLSSDSHAVGSIAACLPEALVLVQQAGFRSLVMPRGGALVDVKL